jgi:hypothetical protein
MLNLPIQLPRTQGRVSKLDRKSLRDLLLVGNRDSIVDVRRNFLAKNPR